MGDKIILVLLFLLFISAVIRHVARTIIFLIDLSRSLVQKKSFR